MVLDPTHRKGLKPADAKFLEIVDKYGWHVTYVAPLADSDDEEVWWAYSTALFFRFRHPEIAVFGLDYENSINIVNLAGDMVKEGKSIETEREYQDFFEDRKCLFRLVDSSQYSEYFGASLWFYEGEKVPILQCFWSDEHGRYPWDADCCAECAQAQPLLFRA